MHIYIYYVCIWCDYIYILCKCIFLYTINPFCWCFFCVLMDDLYNIFFLAFGSFPIGPWCVPYSSLPWLCWQLFLDLRRSKRRGSVRSWMIFFQPSGLLVWLGVPILPNWSLTSCFHVQKINGTSMLACKYLQYIYWCCGLHGSFGCSKRKCIQSVQVEVCLWIMTFFPSSPTLKPSLSRTTTHVSHQCK